MGSLSGYCPVGLEIQAPSSGSAPGSTSSCEMEEQPRVTMTDTDRHCQQGGPQPVASDEGRPHFFCDTRLEQGR